MPAPLHVLCFVHAPDLGGVERAALRLCSTWSAAGVRVTIALGRTDGQDCRGGGSRVRTAPQPPVSPAAVETLWMIWWLRRVSREDPPDLIYCPGNSYTIVAVLLRVLLGQRCPPIVAKISNDLLRADIPRPARWLYHIWCRLQGRLIDHFVAFTPEMRAQAAALLTIPHGRIAIIANPVIDDEALMTLAAAGERARSTRGPFRRFVSAGRLESQKNHALLIAAFARGAAPADTLAIYGEGRLRSSLERQIRRLGLSDRVSLPGRRDTAADWLAQTDVFLLSSDYEGLPAVAVEALAAGMSVIATLCCASLPSVLGGGLGCLVPPGDLTALAEAIANADPNAPDHGLAMARARGFTAGGSAPAFLDLFHGMRAARPNPPVCSDLSVSRA